MKIIDVSHYQDNIDWKTVRQQDIDGVIIRAGYGNGNMDKKFPRNLGMVLENDFPFLGIYWFSYSYTLDMAIREAEAVDSLIRPYQDRLNLGVYFDWEYDSMKYAKKHGMIPKKDYITSMNQFFCETIKDMGYISGYYVNEDYQKNWIDPSRLTNHRKWYARYSSKARPTNAYLHQYTSKGKVKGINGYVDINKLLAPKTVYEVAMEVLEGKWGNGSTRKNKLESAGYDYREVQNLVNNIITMQTLG